MLKAAPYAITGVVRPAMRIATITPWLLSPVLWENIITNMLKDGIQQGIEVGPGRVLQGLARRIDKNFQCTAVNNIETLEQIKN